MRVVKLNLWRGANASGQCDLNDQNRCLCLQILLPYPSLQALVVFMGLYILELQNYLGCGRYSLCVAVCCLICYFLCMLGSNADYLSQQLLQFYIILV